MNARRGIRAGAEKLWMLRPRPGEARFYCASGTELSLAGVAGFDGSTRTGALGAGAALFGAFAGAGAGSAALGAASGAGTGAVVSLAAPAAAANGSAIGTGEL